MNARVHQPVHSPQHAASYYAASVNRQQAYPPLDGERQVDVCIVGGGFSGTLLAINLLRYGTMRVTLVERRPERLGKGVAFGSALPDQ